ncbi:MAG: hypothetical protein QOH04_89 [Sphingomonadales bacterium]|jgi:hypothetical protein|nr:hypothetical protein [Sphingomonadales bacterium]
MKFARLSVALAAALLLASCILSPGRFVSTLDIRKDRSFTFTYQGEVLANDPQLTDDKGKKAPPGPPSADTIAQRKAIAEALSKEEGYRSVEYLGGNKFRVDYTLTGRLDRGFAYPINLDAMAVIPWVAVELRKDGSVRVKAPAFGDMTQDMGAPGTPTDAEGREGTFTLTTDASLVMQNNEEGPAPGPGTKIVWHVTPTTKAVPTAVVRFP